MENIDKTVQPKLEAMKELLQQEDIQRMWMKMHTPHVRAYKKVGRNNICPFCNSGKKYKYCDCYNKRDNYVLDEKHTKGWR